MRVKELKELLNILDEDAEIAIFDEERDDFLHEIKIFQPKLLTETYIYTDKTETKPMFDVCPEYALTELIPQNYTARLHRRSDEPTLYEKFIPKLWEEYIFEQLKGANECLLCKSGKGDDNGEK